MTADETRALGEEAIKAVTGEPSPEEAAKLRAQKKARITQVLDRGILNDRLQNILDAATPKGRVGKFVRDRDEDIIRYQNLGYTFDVVEGSAGLHASGDRRVKVGDLVLMTISKEDAEIIREVEQQRTIRKLGAAKEEYMNLSESHTAAPAFNESSTKIGG